MLAGLTVLSIKPATLVRAIARQASSTIIKSPPKGCVAACFTPFEQNGDVDYSKFSKYFKLLKDFGIKSVFVNGSAGEGASLTLEERRRLAETWMSGKQSGLDKVIVQIGAGNLRDSQALAKHADSIHADGIACIAPTYFRVQSEEILLQYVRQVAASAPNTPFYLYEYNAMTQTSLDVPRFFDLAKDSIPTLVGVKHASADINMLMRCKEYAGGKYHVMYGSDDALLSSLPLGVEDTVPSIFITPMQNRMREAYKCGDMKKALLEQWRCVQVTSLQCKYGSGTALCSIARSIIPMLGFDIGPPRLPQVEFSGQPYKSLQQDLKDIGFFQWVL